MLLHSNAGLAGRCSTSLHWAAIIVSGNHLMVTSGHYCIISEAILCHMCHKPTEEKPTYGVTCPLF